MQKVYNTTGLALLAALATPYALLSMPISPAGIYFLAKTGFVGTLVGFFGTALTNPQYEIKREKVNQT
jgi:FtsH-binding integral membrane protein